MKLTPVQLREHAVEIILDHARDVENLSISEHLEDLDLGDEDHNAATEAIDNLIKKATVEVSWPDLPAVPERVESDCCPPGCSGNFPDCPLA